MKGTGLAVHTALWVLSASTALAQTSAPAIVKPDIAGTIGWLHVNKTELNSYDDWYNRGVQGALMAGWYWSPHVKSELEVSASTRVTLYASTEQLVNGVTTHVFSEHDFSTRRITVGQLYQFGENAWFHPHLGGGIDFNWETIGRHDRERYVFDPLTRQSRFQQSLTAPDRTDLHIRPFGVVGFKAYVTPRAFVRSDMRVIAGERIEEVLVRFGVGVDF